MTDEQLEYIANLSDKTLTEIFNEIEALETADDEIFDKLIEGELNNETVQTSE